MLFTRGETWNNAREKCKKLGAELVKIESADENEFIKTTVLRTTASSPVAYWIGLSDQVKEGEWKWTDGSLLGDKNSNWKIRNPDNFENNENCGSIAFGSFSSNGYFWDWRVE